MQVKAFARVDGLILAMVWLLSMWLFVRQPESSWGVILMLSTPFFIGWRLRAFRDGALGGLISFRRAFCYSCYVFFYASLVFALGQFLYFKYLDNGMFLSTMRQGVETVKPYYEQSGVGTEELETGLKMIELMGPMDLTLIFMMYNLLIGAVVSPFIALLCKKSKL